MSAFDFLDDGDLEDPAEMDHKRLEIRVDGKDSVTMLDPDRPLTRWLKAEELTEVER